MALEADLPAPVARDVLVIRWHLSGDDDVGKPFVAGIYPMLLDETCFFLAVDLDKSSWLEDSTALMETCRRMDLSAALERSRSGTPSSRRRALSEILLTRVRIARCVPVLLNAQEGDPHACRACPAACPRSRDPA